MKIWTAAIVLAVSTGTAARANAEAPSPAQAKGDGVDFIADAKLYYRVVACKGSEPIPSTLDADVVNKHCTEQQQRYEKLNERFLTPAQTFFSGLRPNGLPTTVVYPFGGGDLMSALVTFPDAREITTISLEHAGDPTRLAKLDKKKLAQSLANYRAASSGLLSLHDSTSENMRKLEVGAIPGQLSFHITGMAALGYEPVSLKFFKLADDGKIVYLAQPEIDQLAKTIAKKVKGSWVDTDWSEAFNHMELTMRKAGDPKAPLIVHRHIAWNLNDKGFGGTPLEKHLQSKGKVAAMTKAASYLLWNGGFSKIRDYLLDNMVWMVSDATGVENRFAKKKGFEQVTYGKFRGAFLEEAAKGPSDAMVKVWASQPFRKLPFRYGYPDSEGNIHLMVTKPAEPQK
jgi:hypothetical protein